MKNMMTRRKGYDDKKRKDMMTMSGETPEK